MVCYGGRGGEDDDQLRESGCGAIAGFGGSGTWCHCHRSVG